MFDLKDLKKPSEPAPLGFFAENIPQLPPDPLFGIKAKCNRDTREPKVDLSIGAYRDDDGKPWILPSVRLAEDQLQHSADYNHEYLPITGYQQLSEAAAKVILGNDSKALAEKRVVSIQSLSGTGALHIAGKFIYRFYKPAEGKAGSKEGPTVYLSDPTWANHYQIFENCLLKCASYPYWDKKTKGLRIDDYIAAIKAAPKGSVFVLHATAHNPTGLDPTHEQWEEILKAISDNGHLPLFDTAYQGFTSGDLDKDAWAVRRAVDATDLTFPAILLCQSFAKNCGMYGERVGAFHVVFQQHDAKLNQAVSSQLAKIVRSEISNPPAYGAKLVTKLFTTPELRKQWEEDLVTMSTRIRSMRKALVDELKRLGTPGTWDHITEQQGMFSYTGLGPAEVDKLADKYAIYMAKNGRISIAGLNSGNVKYVAKSVDEAVRDYIDANTEA